MKNENNKKKVSVLISAIIVVILLLIGFTYTYLSSHNKTDRTVQAGTLLIEYSDEGMETVNLSNIQPIYDKDMMEKASKIPFKVINKGTSLAYVEIDLTDITIPDALKNADFKWALYSGDEKISEGNFANVQDKNLSLTKNQEITSSKNYELYIWISETGLDQSDMMEKTFSAKITINGNQHKKVELLSKVIMDNNSPIDTKKPDFTQTAETDEGLIEGDDADGKTYYFRGNVQDNYLKIEGLTWPEDDGYYHKKGDDMLFRIVRINGDKSIRIIADGSIGKSAFNNNYDNEKYVGYTYDNGKQCTSDNICDKNTGTPSTIKTYLESWYETNMTEYDSLFTESRYCNDTSVSSVSGSSVYYGAYDRLKTNKQPTFICPDTDKLYGGEYNLKIGLLSTDEAAFAGGKYNTSNYNYYLAGSSSMRWLGSPFDFGGYAYEFYVGGDGYVGGDIVFGDYAAVPVFNLRSDTLFTQGNGEVNNPYVISVG